MLVRDRIKKGDTDQQALDFIVARYGEFVLLKPRFDLRNAALWGTPIVLLLAGGLFMLIGVRRRKQAAAPLSREETQALNAILDEPD